MAIGIIPYIGGKHRLSGAIAERLHATGADCLVDVFGGSAAVTLNCGFKKRIYNDASGDLVVLFRVLADPLMRREFLRRLRWTPASRRIYADGYNRYRECGFSFAYIIDPIERAAAVFFRHQFAFGGKVRSGGFQVSMKDHRYIKEVARYQNALRRVVGIGDLFRTVLIENLHYQDAISMYGKRSNVVLFCDPPYWGTEKYYAGSFGAADHFFLAQALAECEAPVVATFYDHPRIRSLYPEAIWHWDPIIATKNSQFCARNKTKVAEMILTRHGDRSCVRIGA